MAGILSTLKKETAMHKHIKCEIELDVINDSLAEFKCGNTLHGFIQISQKENITVIIDGGYVLGTFDCDACALKEVALLAARIEEADKKYGISYQRLKELSYIASSVHFFYAI
ncbi:DNA breaking-rejoining protein [Escherichia coli]|nr:DNA breaking-rejoining protein [Escherichia coli]EFN7690758.1 DNA breaking-rejoining protein [Escherichia coli]EFN7709065.1 DNA breaking-rejoining protein [Escherichia coli]EFN7720852.1 DNA breaking-rejoining protein [Escherichia coli]EFN7789916.1 DNA breaking-rejoining protein [Escherichia coli]